MKWLGYTLGIGSLCTLCLFVMLGIGGVIQSRFASPVSFLQGLTASVSSSFFYEMMALEVPRLPVREEGSIFSTRNMVDYAIQLVTDIRPGDAASLLAIEVPGLRTASSDVPRNELYEEHSSRTSTITNEDQQSNDQTDEQELNESPSQSNPAEPDEVEPVHQGLSTKDKKVFIYHSHNRESWIPELQKKGVKSLNEAFDPEINVTLLGARLAERLQDLGIGAISSDKDYPTAVKDYNWNFSYKYSLETIKEAFALHPEIEYFFDIHRDAQKRELTTVDIDGVSYAQVYFIIGRKNPNWQQNEAFAQQIHNRMEQKYPGISRGIWGKKASNGHAEYNQSFSDKSILIEIGGPENTLEESYRTIDILAGVIAEIILEAEKVDLPLTPPPKAS